MASLGRNSSALPWTRSSTLRTEVRAIGEFGFLVAIGAPTLSTRICDPSLATSESGASLDSTGAVVLASVDHAELPPRLHGCEVVARGLAPD